MAHILLMARGMNNKLPASLTVVLVALSACGLPDPVAAGSQSSQVASAHPLGGKASTTHVFTVNHDDGNGPPPASADISQYNPPVGDQGQIGDCTTWAFGYAMGGYLAAQAGATQEFAPMYIFTQLAPRGSTDSIIMTMTPVTVRMTSGRMRRKLSVRFMASPWARSRAA